MASGSDFFNLLSWGWLDWFFGRNWEEQEPVRFSEDVRGFLTNIIQFEDRSGTTFYLLVKRIELLETSYDQQYTFDFEISLDPPPPGYAPRVGKSLPAEIETTVFRYGEHVHSTPLFGYVFTSLNSLAQNKENLREFVLLQRDQGDEDLVKYEQRDGGNSASTAM